jgi:hypothetical protein
MFSVLLLVHQAPVLPPRDRPERPLGRGRLILLLLLISVAMRSLLGLALSFPWTAPLLVLAGALGKGLGGVLANRFGWMRTAVCSLTMSIPLLMFGTASHVEKILAMLLVATTMPVALAAVSESLPREPAFAFGLTAFALLVGVLPGFSHLRPLASMREPMVAALLVCALALSVGLRLGRLSHSRQPQNAE